MARKALHALTALSPASSLFLLLHWIISWAFAQTVPCLPGVPFVTHSSFKIQLQCHYDLARIVYSTGSERYVFHFSKALSLF